MAMSRRLLRLFLPLAAFLSFWRAGLSAQEIKDLPIFTSDDRVLVLAPHPDDEAIAASGVIQRAIKAGAKVRVACYTNGDANELAFIVYEKRLVFRKSQFLYMGEVRRRETLSAMASLGLDKEDDVFLGYPDFGTMQIFTKYWGEVSPYVSLLTRVDKVSYPDTLSFCAPYVGESILRDLTEVITAFRPSKIFVSHPVDTNGDHRSLYLFLRAALWGLEGNIRMPDVFPYLIHAINWPLPRGYHPQARLLPPGRLEADDINWFKLELTEEEVKKKHGAISVYKSQIKYSPAYLFTFARENELFGDYPAVRLKHQRKDEPLQWTGEGAAHAPSMEGGSVSEGPSDKVAYSCRDGDLYLRLALKKKIENTFWASIFLVGYSKAVGFDKMPKIHINVGEGAITFRDKKDVLPVKDAGLEYKGNTLIIKIPLYVLGNPCYILSCVRTNSEEIAYAYSGWHTLYLE